MVMAVVMILHRLVSGKYFLQSGLRVLELLVKMDIVYEDKDKIILNKPVGQLSQSGKSFEMDLVSEVLTYRKSKGEEADISRLDIHLITGRHHQIRVQLSRQIGSKIKSVSEFKNIYSAIQHTFQYEKLNIRSAARW